MLDGIAGVAGALIPVGRAQVQERDLLRVVLLQPRAQQLAEEVVVAEPLPLVIQGDNEKVGSLEALDEFLDSRAVHAGHCLAQLGVEPFKQRGLEEKSLNVFRLAGDDFLGQKIQDEAVTAGKRLDEAVEVVLAFHRQGGHLQPGNPAFGARFEGRHIGGVQVEAHTFRQEGSGFGGAEAQIGGAQLEQLAPGAQASQRHRRVGARSDHQVHHWRQVVEQVSEDLVYRAGGDEMIIVQNKGKMEIDAVQFLQQDEQNSLRGQPARRVDAG